MATLVFYGMTSVLVFILVGCSPSVNSAPAVNGQHPWLHCGGQIEGVPGFFCVPVNPPKGHDSEPKMDS